MKSKSKSTFTLSRRTMLRGLAGGTLATIGLPVFEAMLDSNGEALAGGTPLPKRFLTFMFGNGVLLPRWVPSATGTGYALTEQLLPLAPVKSYVNVLSGFQNKMPVITHHEGMAGMWSGHPYSLNSGLNSDFGGPSIDQVAADILAPGTAFRSIEIGVSKRVSDDEGTTMQFMSHRGTNQPNPPQYNPRLLWNSLFNGGQATDPSRPHRVSVLDAVKGDIDRLKARLGAFDRARLDAHLTSVNELQGQIGSVAPCSPIAEPTEDNVDENMQEAMPAVAAAMSGLLVHAFTCDLSRVASYMLTGGVGSTVYSHLGQGTQQHFMTHDLSFAYNEEINDGIVWNMQTFANLLVALEGVQEGASNILDNTVAILGSDCAQGYNHGTRDMPVVVAGGGGGALANPGTHHRATGDRNLSDVLLTSLQAISPAITSVGSGVGLSSTPVSEILA